MSHFMCGVILPRGFDAKHFNGTARALINLAMAPYHEEEASEDRAKWDWFRVGGRWDGAIKGLDPIRDDGKGGFNFGEEFTSLERNAVKVDELLDNMDRLPFALVDGAIAPEWHEKGQMGWFANVTGEDPHWPDMARKVLEKRRGQWVVGLDCHI